MQIFIRRIARRAFISIEKIILHIFLLSVGHIHYGIWIEVIRNADSADPFRKRGFIQIFEDIITQRFTEEAQSFTEKKFFNSLGAIVSEGFFMKN